MKNTQIAVQEIHTVRGIELGVRKHFTRSEWKRLRARNDKTREVRLLSFDEIDKISNPKDVFKDSEARGYFYMLAYFQRIRVPIEVALNFNARLDLYPLSETNNFIIFEEIFETHYSSIPGFKMDVNNMQRKSYAKREIEFLVLSFWFAGYGVIPGLTHDAISEDILNSIYQKYRGDKYWQKRIHWLWRLLLKEPKSLVKSEFKPNKFTTIPDTELNLWNQEVMNNPSELSLSLYNFVFGNMLKRVNDYSVEEHEIYEGSESRIIRVTKDPITSRTWRGYSAQLRHFAKKCNEFGYVNIADVLDTQVLAKVKNEVVGGASYSNRFSSSVGQWLHWYKDNYDNNLNVNRIFPVTRKRATKAHGRIYDITKAKGLIYALLDNYSGLIDENNILSFRCRRACLIMLATGARPQDVLLLMRDSLKKTANGPVLLFHKTKTKGTVGKLEWVHQAEVQNDVVNWFEELKMLGPSSELYFPYDGEIGDNLTAFRLFGNVHDNGPLRLSSLRYWFDEFQRALWPDQKPYFKPKDLRSLRATYRIIKGAMNGMPQIEVHHQIKEELGHSNIASQIPYTETIDPDTLRLYEDLYKEGVWNVSAEPGDNGVPLSDTIGVDSKFAASSKFVKNVQEMIDHIIQSPEYKNFTPTGPKGSSPNYVGFPRGTHNCEAHILINCGHTEDHCLQCRHYKPDSGTEEIHKAKVLCNMVYALYCEDAEKRWNDRHERDSIFEKAQSIRARIKGMITHTFIERFQMDRTSAQKMEQSLWKQSRAYWRKYGKIQPKPNIHDARYYLEHGELKVNVPDA